MSTTTNTKPTRSTSTDVPQQLRDVAETGAKHSKEALDKMGAATTEVTDAVTHCCSAALK